MDCTKIERFAAQRSNFVQFIHLRRVSWTLSLLAECRRVGEKNLRRMVQFTEVFRDPEIVAALLRQLGWQCPDFLLMLFKQAQACPRDFTCRAVAPVLDLPINEALEMMPRRDLLNAFQHQRRPLIV